MASQAEKQLQVEVFCFDNQLEYLSSFILMIIIIKPHTEVFQDSC